MSWDITEHIARCWIGDEKYLDKHKTRFILCKRQCLYLNADADADANADADAEMPLSCLIKYKSWYRKT